MTLNTRSRNLRGIYISVGITVSIFDEKSYLYVETVLILSKWYSIIFQVYSAHNSEDGTINYHLWATMYNNAQQ